MGTYKIMRCGRCNQQLRVPSDKEILVTCPKCKNMFRTNVREKKKRTFVDDLYPVQETSYPKEDSFMKYYVIRNHERKENDNLHMFMVTQIRENKEARHFTQKLYFLQNNGQDDFDRITVSSSDHNMNWTVVKEMIENKIREYNLGIKSFTVTIKDESMNYRIKEEKTSFFGKPRYKTMQNTYYTIWISASW